MFRYLGEASCSATDAELVHNGGFTAAVVVANIALCLALIRTFAGTVTSGAPVSAGATASAATASEPGTSRRVVPTTTSRKFVRRRQTPKRAAKSDTGDSPTGSLKPGGGAKRPPSMRNMGRSTRVLGSGGSTRRNIGVTAKSNAAAIANGAAGASGGAEAEQSPEPSWVELTVESFVEAVKGMVRVAFGVWVRLLWEALWSVLGTREQRLY